MRYVLSASTDHERHAQKSRTREAILAAARDLVGGGATVTLQAVAERAGVSRATAYRYFSDPSVLAAEAGLALEVERYETIVADCATVQDRLLAISVYFFDLAVAHEAGFRQFLARWLDAWDPETKRVSRGARRVAMFERALDEGGATLPDSERGALVSGLAMTTGTEAMIALLDVAGADRATARATVRDLAAMIIDKHLPR